MNLQNILDKINNSKYDHFEVVQSDMNFTNDQIMNYIDYLIYNNHNYLEFLDRFYKHYEIDNFYSKILDVIKTIVNKNKNVFEYIDKKYRYKIEPIINAMIINDEAVMILNNTNENDHFIICYSYKEKWIYDFHQYFSDFSEENSLKLFNLTKRGYINCLKIENTSLKMDLEKDVIYINTYI